MPGNSPLDQDGGNKARFAHFGDPCIFCGIGHDDIAPGVCPANDGKLRVAHFAQVNTRWDGYIQYRYRTTDGRVHETWRHASDHAPYWHFGHRDEFGQTPAYDHNLLHAQVTA